MVLGVDVLMLMLMLMWMLVMMMMMPACLLACLPLMKADMLSAGYSRPC